MRLQDSAILQVTLSKLFPFAVLLSMSMFSYGASFPGGGFQAGVVIGSYIVIYEIALDRPTWSTAFYGRIEVLGLAVLLGALVWGWLRLGAPFGAVHAEGTGRGLLWANPFIWLLNLGIYLEVCGSMVLIFRQFIHWPGPHAQPAAAGEVS